MKVAVFVRRVSVVSALLSGCVDDAHDGGSESGASRSSDSEASSDGEGSTSPDDDASTGPTSNETGTAPDETGAEAGGTSAGPMGTGAQPEVCAQMFACLAEVAPEVAAPLLALYGDDGSCWQLDPGEQAICAAACEGHLQVAHDLDLWDQRVCSGVFEPTDTMGPENTDAACSDMIDNDGNGFVDCDDFECSLNRRITVC
jgi:hypothetical protein